MSAVYNMAGSGPRNYLFVFGRGRLSVQLDGFLDHIRFIIFFTVAIACGSVIWLFSCGSSTLDCIVIDVLRNMEQAYKKRKLPAQTVTDRSSIGANWQQLLASSLMSDEKPKEERPERYAGTFRRARKRNKNAAPVLPDMKSLDIATESGADAKPLAGAPPEEKSKLTKYLAMDCEMVGIGPTGDEHMVARVSIVNRFGECVLDRMVKAREEVKDYRTQISGIRKEDMLNGEEFTKVQREVAELLRGRILVGHSLKNDLAVLFLSHPKRNIRDTSRYKPFRKITKGSTPSLKRLAKELLGADIQGGEHSSVEDARAAMQLYCCVARAWEGSVNGRKK